MEDYIVSALGYAIYLLIIALAGFLVEWIRQKIGTEKMQVAGALLENHRSLFLMGVSTVEQKYKALHGQEKANQAAQIISKEARERGIKITETQIMHGIEWAVRTFKDSFGEEWSSAIEEDEDSDPG